MEYDLIDAYVILEEEGFDSSTWNSCPVCKAKPKVWIFDNGRFADCKCGKKYSKRSVKAISIGEYVRNNNGSMARYPDDELRINWNRRCEELEKLLNINPPTKLIERMRRELNPKDQNILNLKTKPDENKV